MKIILFIAILSTLLSISLSTVSEAEIEYQSESNYDSDQITNEYEALRENFMESVEFTRNFFIKEVIVAARSYYDLYQFVKEDYQRRLTDLNYNGAIIAAKVTNPVNTVLARLDKLFQPEALGLRIDDFLFEVISEILTPYDSLVNSWATIAVNDSKVKTCWDEIDSGIENQFEGLSMDLLSNLTLKMFEADEHAQALNTTVFKEILEVEHEVTKKCVARVSCYTEYFNKNLPSIHNKIKGYGATIEGVLASLFKESRKMIRAAIDNVVYSIDSVNESFSQCYN